MCSNSARVRALPPTQQDHLRRLQECTAGAPSPPYPASAASYAGWGGHSGEAGQAIDHIPADRWQVTLAALLRRAILAAFATGGP
jgi:hypothetical protein